LRDFFWRENALCLEKADERGGSLRICCLLLRGHKSGPGQGYDEKYD